ncbi:hypothetical protein [Streptomyces cyaneofuscatus]|nr:hypothetical protein OG973_01710 [Streptomyces cyaneofuscatus]
MGSLFKECEHSESRWPRCPHDDKIRYRNAAGRQAEESGFSTQVEPEPVLVNRATLKLIERGDVEQAESLLRRISRSVTEQ